MTSSVVVPWRKPSSNVHKAEITILELPDIMQRCSQLQPLATKTHVQLPQHTKMFHDGGLRIVSIQL
jgi:hypothetical protein